MEGTVYLRGRIWWIQYYRGGKKFRESSGSVNRADAVRLLRVRLAQAHLGQLPELGDKKAKLEDLIELVRRDYILNNRRTLGRLECVASRLLRNFGGMRADRITAAMISDFVMQRFGEGVCPATLNRELTVLRRAFNLAEREGLVKSMPHIPRFKEDNVRTGFLEHEQFLAMRELLPPYLRDLFTMAYETGMRRGELLSLTWSMVDLKEGCIRLEAAHTKTSEPRLIFLTQEGLTALKSAWLNRVPGCELVFHRKGKKIVDFRKSWDKARQAAGVPDLLFHDLRRSALRRMVRAGIPERVAMSISGHKTREVFDRYNIVSEGDLREAARKLDGYRY